MSDLRHLGRIGDLTPSGAAAILARATALMDGALPTPPTATKILGVVMLATSLRTRTGFESAAARLGWETVEVADVRHSEVSSHESLDDTLRVLSGYCDALVVRTRTPLSVPDLLPAPRCPVVNVLLTTSGSATGYRTRGHVTIAPRQRRCRLRCQHGLSPHSPDAGQIS